MSTMTRLVLLSATILALAAPPATAASITFTAPGLVNGPFDLVVRAENLFAGRDPTDLLIAYGFNVTVSDPAVLAVTGATSGPLFDAATTAPGTGVFAAAFGQNGFGIEPGAAEPVILVTLHVNVLQPGPASIQITSDLANLFQGLQYLHEPLHEPIAGAVHVEAVAAVPEPATLVLVGCGTLAAAWRRRFRPNR